MEVGKYIHEKLLDSKYGDKVIDEIVSPLVTQLTWTNHLKIMSACKSKEERLFYEIITIGGENEK